MSTLTKRSIRSSPKGITLDQLGVVELDRGPIQSEGTEPHVIPKSLFNKVLRPDHNSSKSHLSLASPVKRFKQTPLSFGAMILQSVNSGTLGIFGLFPPLLFKSGGKGFLCSCMDQLESAVRARYSTHPMTYRPFSPAYHPFPGPFHL